MWYRLPLRLLIGLALWLAGELATAQANFRVVLEPDGVTYSVFMRSATSYTGNAALISTVQITLVVPHGTGPDRFGVVGLSSSIPNMRWQQNDRVDAPAENPDVDYLFFSFINNSSPTVLFPILAGQDILLFQFRRMGTCLGTVQPMHNGTDAFRSPNSRGVNSGNSLSVLGARGNIYQDDAVPPPLASLTLSSSAVCAGESLTMTASVSPNAGRTYDYQFFMDDQPLAPASSASVQTYRVPTTATSRPGVIRVRIKEAGVPACESPVLTARKPVLIRPVPVAEIAFTGSGCIPLPTTLTARSVQNGQYEWFENGVAVSGGQGNELRVEESGQYSVAVTVNGCRAASSAVSVLGVTQAETVSVRLSPVPLLVGGMAVQLTPVVSNAVSFSWTPADGLSNTTAQNPTARPRQTTTYTLVARSAQGCPATDTVTVRVVPPLYIPGAFSPNADGLNDTWVIQNVHLHQPCQVQIFDRWGVPVFQSDHYQNDWKADKSGQPLAAGVYLYVVRTVLALYRGSVTLLR